jgi:hypothetical protein
MKVDVIVVVDSRGAHAAKQATPTIPIVMVAVGNPELQGLVASLARPGGNVTGLSNQGAQLGEKSLQILKDVFARRIRVALLFNPEMQGAVMSIEPIVAAAKALGMEPIALAASSAADLKRALDSVIRERADVLVPGLALWAHRERIQDFAEVRPCDQHEDCDGVWNHHPGFCAAARGRDHRMTTLAWSQGLHRDARMRFEPAHTIRSPRVKRSTEHAGARVGFRAIVHAW